MSWRNSYEARKNTPKKETIYKYWHPLWPEKKLPNIRGCEFIEGEERCCFACGHFSNIERCHIKPLVDGGENTVENLHLLCRSCHSVSEGNPNYWQWLSYMREKVWKPRVDWVFKICEMNGTNMEQWFEKHEPIRFTRQWFKETLLLQLNNGITFEPKPDCGDEWKELMDETMKEWRAEHAL